MTHSSPADPGSFVCQNDSDYSSVEVKRTEECKGMWLQMQPHPHEATPLPVQAGTWQAFVREVVAQQTVPAVWTTVEQVSVTFVWETILNEPGADV